MKNTKTRKSLSLLLAVIMIMSTMSLMTIGSFAETSGDFEYTVLDDGTAEITKYNGSATELLIPSTLDGYSVTSIGEYAFFDCASILSITIPESVTTIGSSAFESCTSLTDISIPYGVSSIGWGAFYDCTSLTSIAIPDSVTSIVDFAFFGCTSLSNITIPDNVTIIGDGAFRECTSLKSIIVDSNNAAYSSVDGVLLNKDATEIICYPAGKTATEYTISNSVTSIVSFAFYDCTSLSSITIPDSVKNIGKGAFQGCSSLTNITIPDSITSIEWFAFRDCTSLANITIPDSVTSIGDWSFFGCTSLTSITIPNSVTSIGNDAFRNCTSLACVTIPDSVTNIGNYSLGYYYDDYGYKVIEDFIIYGYKGTAAEEYADNNGIEFIPLGGFPDVKQENWYFEAVIYNEENGFITGYSNGNFGPADQLKRQDFVVILARIAGADLEPYKSVQSKMPDVIKGSYYAAAVNWAVDNHIINGYNNGKFGVGDPITREQVATILYRYMGSPAVTGADNTLKPFADANKISSFAKDAVVWAIQNGVISGKKPDTLAPTVTASRAEIATIVMRMDKAGMFAE